MGFFSKLLGKDNPQQQHPTQREEAKSTKEGDVYSELDKKILQLPADVINAAEEGINYYQGRNGRSIDHKKAFEKLSYAAERGHISAQYGLAMLYFHGKGTSANKSEAIEWLTKASEEGMGEAQSELGILLFNRR